MGSRVALLGLDSTDHRFVDRLIAEGRLPMLARLRERSARVRLVAEGPLGRVWEAFLLGHPVPDDAYVVDPETYQPWWRGATPDPPFFGDDGARVVSLDMPFDSAARKFSGVQVIGWGGHNPGHPRSSRPAGLLSEIDARFGPHPTLHDDHGEWHHTELLTGLGARLAEGLRTRARVALDLLDRVPDWELLLLGVAETHSGAEGMWHGVADDHPLVAHPAAPAAAKALVRVYEALDEAVGVVVTALPPETTTVICSMHGVQPDGLDLPTLVLLPELLYRLEFRRLFLLPSVSAERWRRAGYPPVSPRRDQSWTAYMRWRELEARVQETAGGLRRWIGRTRRSLLGPPDLTTRFNRRQGGSGGPEALWEWPDGSERPRYPTEGHFPAWYRASWPRMRAFALPSVYMGRIRVNLEGREPGGLVSVEDYRRVRDEVETALRACRDPRTGRPVVADIERADHADPREVAPWEMDLLVHWQGYPDAFEHPDLGTIGPFPFKRTGGHTTEGFAWFSGDGVPPDDLGEHPAADLPPTVLALLGREIPSRVRGEAIAVRTGVG